MNARLGTGAGSGRESARSCLTHLECSECGTRYDAFVLQGLCTACGRPLLARYDLARAAALWGGPARDRTTLSSAPDPTRAAGAPSGGSAAVPSLWRYAEVLPAAGEPVSLGEGWTPLLAAPRLARELGADIALHVKDESINPTGSFKARGLSAAVTMAKERGVTRLAIPTAGNAGLALAAYASAAGMAADVFCPADTPEAFMVATALLGARVHRVDGFITDCARRVREGAAATGWFDMSTLKEPYRVEGKKTMGYELREQLGKLPDVILYPTGGGTGLVGMWKAFEELEALGAIGRERPRMVSVQAEGCAPIVRAFRSGAAEAVPWEDPVTVASGLRVPAAVGDRWMLRALRDSGGTAVAVPDAAMIAGAELLGRTEGILAAPEGGAVVAALRELLANGEVRPGETVVLFNTGTALSYMEAFAKR